MSGWRKRPRGKQLSAGERMAVEGLNFRGFIEIEIGIGIGGKRPLVPKGSPPQSLALKGSISIATAISIPIDLLILNPCSSVAKHQF